MNPKILAVDDDLGVLEAMQVAFANSEFQIDLAHNANACLELIKRNPIGYSLVFVDHNLSSAGSGDNGDVLARRIKDINPTIMVVMVSGQRSEHVLRSWLDAGVDQFLIKPTESFELLSLAENAHSRYLSNYGFAARDPQSTRNSKASEALRKTKIVANSPSMSKVAESALLFAQNNYNVLILGETGTGKEVVANAIHQNSPSAKKPFLPINCSGFRGSENLLESELFGHEKGAFTGADRLKVGVFESAQGGIVFLDEVHHLSPSAQAKLLRVIQHRKVRRVGGTAEIPVSFRLISAGKPDLRETITLDLFYRIRELQIDIPPLRERLEDVAPLVRHFKSVFEHELGRKVEILDGTLRALEAHDWPGNVRELESLVKELLVTTLRPVIRAQDLPVHFNLSSNTKNDWSKLFNLLIAEQELQQRDLLATALQEAQNNVSQAAANLQIPRSTLRDLMKKFGLSDSSVKMSERIK